MTDIVELLENLSVSPHQQSIIDSAVDEIVGLREEKQKLIAVEEQLFEVCQRTLDEVRQITSEALLWAEKEIKRLREGLNLIANNSCCGTCQEAALIAKRTLEGNSHEQTRAT